MSETTEQDLARRKAEILFVIAEIEAANEKLEKLEDTRTRLKEQIAYLKGWTESREAKP